MTIRNEESLTLDALNNLVSAEEISLAELEALIPVEDITVDMLNDPLLPVSVPKEDIMDIVRTGNSVIDFAMKGDESEGPQFTGAFLTIGQIHMRMAWELVHGISDTRKAVRETLNNNHPDAPEVINWYCRTFGTDRESLLDAEIDFEADYEVNDEVRKLVKAIFRDQPHRLHDREINSKLGQAYYKNRLSIAYATFTDHMEHPLRQYPESPNANMALMLESTEDSRMYMVGDVHVGPTQTHQFTVRPDRETNEGIPVRDIRIEGKQGWKSMADTIELIDEVLDAAWEHFNAEGRREQRVRIFEAWVKNSGNPKNIPFAKWENDMWQNQSWELRKQWSKDCWTAHRNVCDMAWGGEMNLIDEGGYRIWITDDDDKEKFADSYVRGIGQVTFRGELRNFEAVLDIYQPKTDDDEVDTKDATTELIAPLSDDLDIDDIF